MRTPNRWGKTRLGAALCIAAAAQSKRAWWIAPSYKVAAVGWRAIATLGMQIPGAQIRQVDKQVILPGGGWAQVRSADNPQSLRGEGLDFVVIDECAFVKEPTWGESLRPSLSDRQGGALFISTPKGHNWFWRLYQNGLDGDAEWQSWQFPTSSNPFIDAGEIATAQATLPDRIFRQEYLAEFMSDAGGVFRGVMDCATAEPQEPVDGHQYVFGVDWGKHSDFTVITVLDIGERRIVWQDRFNQIDYRLQRQRLAALNDRYKPFEIIAESNAMGEPIIEQLQMDGLPVTAFNTTNATKAAAIEALALAFEKREIAILNDDILIGELQAFEMTRTPSGMVKYAAPAGMHDDAVMSLALAWQGAAYTGAWVTLL